MVRPMTCPVCGKAVAPATDPVASTAPFCSPRCRQIDFARWSDGRYAIIESLTPDKIGELTAELIDPDDYPEE